MYKKVIVFLFILILIMQIRNEVRFNILQKEVGWLNYRLNNLEIQYSSKFYSK